jgi:hypothetical protein
MLARVLGEFALQDISVDAADAHPTLAGQDHAAKELPAKHKPSDNEQ